MIEKKCVDFVNKVNNCNGCVADLNDCLILIENMRTQEKSNKAATDMLENHKDEMTEYDVDTWVNNAKYHATLYNTIRIQAINKINGIIASLAKIIN